MQDNQTFIAKVRENLALAELLFGIDASRVRVEIRMKGHRCAGKAWRIGNQYGIRFHPLAVKKYWSHMVNDTIPHEVAHIVCYMKPELGCNHNVGWKMVCRRLGGTGDRLHTLNLDEARIAKKPQVRYLYRTSNGREITISGVRHSRIQRGAVYRDQTRATISASGYVGRVRG